MQDVDASDTIGHKAIVRLAQAEKAMNQPAQARDTLLKLKSIKPFTAQEQQLYHALESAVVALPAKTTTLKTQATGDSALRPMKYKIIVQDPILQATMDFDYHVPEKLCTENPDRSDALLFLRLVVETFEDEVCNSRSWNCAFCGERTPNRRGNIVHTPMSYLTQTPPLILDFAQPVCKTGGKCEEACRKTMAEMMRQL